MANYTSFWLKFFGDAGIQSGIDKKYASIFEENRIKPDMMMDLDKDLLKEMKITAIGDILAILKHAKKVNEQNKEEAVDIHRPVTSSTTPDNAAVKKSVVRPVQSTNVAVSKPAQVAQVESPTQGLQQEVIRIGLRKTVSNTVLTAPKEASSSKIVVLNKRGSTDQPLREEVPVQKKIRVLPEHEGGYKIKMPEGSIPRTQKALQSRLGPKESVTVATASTSIKRTVFSRLGDSVVTSTSQSVKVETAVAPETRKSSIFARLGGKSSTDNAPLEKALVQQQTTSRTSKVDPRVYAEKTLKTIPSKISIAAPSSGASTSKNSPVSQVSSTVSSSISTTTRKVILQRTLPNSKCSPDQPKTGMKTETDDDNHKPMFVRSVVFKKRQASTEKDKRVTLPAISDLKLPKDLDAESTASVIKKQVTASKSPTTRTSDRRPVVSELPLPVVSSVIQVVSSSNTKKITVESGRTSLLKPAYLTSSPDPALKRSGSRSGSPKKVGTIEAKSLNVSRQKRENVLNPECRLPVSKSRKRSDSPSVQKRKRRSSDLKDDSTPRTAMKQKNSAKSDSFSRESLHLSRSRSPLNRRDRREANEKKRQSVRSNDRSPSPRRKAQKSEIPKKSDTAAASTEQTGFGVKKFQRFEVKPITLTSSKPIRINLKARPERQPVDPSVLEINASPESSIASCSPDRDDIGRKESEVNEDSSLNPAGTPDAKVVFTPKDLDINNIFSLVHKSRDRENIVVGCINDKMIKPKKKAQYDTNLSCRVSNERFQSYSYGGSDYEDKQHAGTSSVAVVPRTRDIDYFMNHSALPYVGSERIYRDRQPEDYRPSRESFAYDSNFVKEQNKSDFDINGEEIIRIERPAEDKPMQISKKAEEMIQKMGWTPGQGLGKNKQGRKAPIEAASSAPKPGYVGLGFNSKI